MNSNEFRGCLVSAKSSVLLNGSPTKEFQLHRGLRQGDPLSPFLFILSMEGLHILIEDAVQYSQFKGLAVGSLAIVMSHLFYADDAIFMGEWDRDNVESLIRILNIFDLASGLQLNLQKSKLYGLGVAENEVQVLARCTGCGADSVPFMYLGLPIGERMYRVNSGRPLMAKFKKRLANWKCKLMSIGGRLTLVRSVLGSLGIYYLSLFPIPVQVNKQLESMRSRFFCGIDDNEKKIQWVKWDSILNSKEKGRLDVGSLWAFNQALLLKWRWRFLNGNDMLWVKLIKSYHGIKGSFLDGGITPPKSGVWVGIVKVSMELHTRDLIPTSAFRRKVGNGRNTRFWKEMWCGDRTLEATFPRLAALASNKNASVSNYWSTQGWNISWRRDIRGGAEQTQHDQLMVCLQIININLEQDVWQWEFDNEETFTVRSVRNFLDIKRLPGAATTTRWCNILPIKVNVFVWRAILNRLPIRSNLDRRGINIDSLLCPCYHCNVEDINHVFFACNVAVELWIRIGVWLELDIPEFVNVEDMFQWIDGQGGGSTHQMILKTSCVATIWILWMYRNSVVFDGSRVKKHQIFDSVVIYSFHWTSNRNRKSRFNWNAWMQNPRM